jgi:hypothetical protein
MDPWRQVDELPSEASQILTSLFYPPGRWSKLNAIEEMDGIW